MKQTTLSKEDIEFAHPVEREKKYESNSSSILNSDSEEDLVDDLPMQGPG